MIANSRLDRINVHSHHFGSYQYSSSFLICTFWTSVSESVDDINFSLSTMSSSINTVLDNTAGKAQKAQGESLSTFLASLTISGVILRLGIIAYMLLKFSYPEF